MQSEPLPYSPRGFRSCVRRLGIRDESLDFAIIASDVPAHAAAMFTQSRFCGAGVVVGREHIANGRLQAFVINSKNANVATGKEGLANIREVVRLVAGELGIDEGDVLPSSTGLIGCPLPMDKIRSGVAGVGQTLRKHELHLCAEAIMTTDTRSKMRSCKVGDAVLVGIAKGVAMLEPDMATMLSYFMTDANVDAAMLQDCLSEAVNLSFNMVSVDTDTSTSDTVAIMANGLAGDVPVEAFRKALNGMAIELAQELARDGEGTTKLVEVRVTDAASFAQAKRVAKSIVNSPLVKAAIFGADPNWGRVVMAIGKCSEDTDITPDNVTVAFGELPVYRGGPLCTEPLDDVAAYLHESEVTIHVSLGTGQDAATVWGCDLTYEYVRINSEYAT